MKADFKIQSLISSSEDIHLRQALGGVYIYAFVVHFIFLFAFRYFGAKQMEFINYFSLLFYITSFFLNYKGRISLGATIGVSEAVIHGSLSIIYVGWNANFHLYIVLVYLLIFFLYRLKIGVRILISVLITLVYAFSYIYSVKHAPLNSFPFGFIGTAGIINIINTAVVLSLFALSYSYYIRRNIKLLKEAETQQKLLNAQKNKFFSIFSHDLKNPISTLNNFTELLLDRYDNMEEEKRRKYLTQIHSTIGDTYKLVMSLLDWSQSQMNNIQLVPKVIQVENAIYDIINLLKHHAETKEIKFEVLIDRSITVFADAHSFHSIMRNIISNAIKFTSFGGKITISAKTENNLSYISVEDSGIGISEDNLKNIFSFERNETSVGTAHERGTGLGLIVVKEFVEKNNGSIKVISKIDSGSTFTISLPSS